jgi:hypothetical protein
MQFQPITQKLLRQFALITPTITILFNFIAIIPSGIEPVTFWLVAQCLNRATECPDNIYGQYKN